MKAHRPRRLLSNSNLEYPLPDPDRFYSALELLSGRDKALALMYAQDGHSIRYIAAVSGLDEVALSRKLKKIFLRLQRWVALQTCLSRLYSRLEERIAREYLVGGLSQRAVAAKLDCTRYTVQKTLRALSLAS